MIAFEKVLPTESLRPYIDRYLFVRISKAHEKLLNTGGLSRLPSPNVSMIIFFSAPSFKKERNQTLYLPQMSICGFNSGPKAYYCPGGLNQMMISFTPAGIQHLLNFQLTEISDTHADLRDVFPREYNWLSDRLQSAATNRERITIIESIFLAKLRRRGLLNQDIFKISRRILQKKGSRRLKDLADEFGTSERTIQRLILKYVGVNFKSFSRLVRFEAAQRQLNSPIDSLTSVAFEAGYFDQAHFIHEFKTLSGLTPGEYLKHENQLVWKKIIDVS